MYCPTRLALVARSAEPAHEAIAKEPICKVSIYSILRGQMISSFKHKGLGRFFETGDRRGLNPDHVEKIALIFMALHSAGDIEVMRLPSFRLHQLTGDLKGFWSVTVRANWRIVFRFEGGNAFDVELTDYH